MGLSDFVAEQREKHALSAARPHLEGGEEVLDWVRTRHPHRRGHGFAYLTTRKLLIVWSGQHDGHGAVAWDELENWGVDAQARAGPMLFAESPMRRILVHIPVRSHHGAQRASAFVRKLARLAPSRQRGVHRAGESGDFESDPSRFEITKAKLSPSDLTKRIVVTLIGLLLIFTGVAITWVPGPWSLPLLLAGLAVMASEYDWARDTLEWVKATSRSARERLRARRAEP